MQASTITILSQAIEVGFGFLSLWILHICLGITRGVLDCGLAIDIKKYLKAKEELRKLKYFTMQKKKKT
jgi:hypothetical protein